MEARKQMTPPAPPRETCEFCGRAFVFTLFPDWMDRLAGLQRYGFSPGHAAHWAYGREDHPRCAEEYALRQETEVVTKARRAAVERWYGAKFLPLDARSKTFEAFERDPENGQAYALARAWRSTDDFGLVLIGPAGTGKSHLGFAILNQIIQEKEFAPIELGSRYESFTLPNYFSVSELLAAMRANNGSTELPKAIESPEVLFLDDLGTENITEWSRDILFRVFEFRLNHRLPTIITTNLLLSELKDRLHERVTSRMLALCVPINLKGKDRRRDVLADRMRILAERARSA